jgi:hypothetical protein
MISVMKKFREINLHITSNYLRVNHFLLVEESQQLGLA